MHQDDLPYSPKLALWYFEAHREIGLQVDKIDRRYAIFPQRFYKTVEKFDKTKIYDFNFIGTFLIDQDTAANRAWIIDFIKVNFSSNSFLQFTDQNTKKSHVVMGDFDHTFTRTGFVPKETPLAQRNFFDESYYKVMSNSKFTLCPAGDVNWSMRFYEALMCKSIPILLDRTGYRTIQEAELDYKYYTLNDELEFVEDWADQNYDIFLKHHTLHFQAAR